MRALCVYRHTGTIAVIISPRSRVGGFVASEQQLMLFPASAASLHLLPVSQSSCLLSPLLQDSLVAKIKTQTLKSKGTEPHSVSRSGYAKVKVFLNDSKY